MTILPVNQENKGNLISHILEMDRIIRADPELKEAKKTLAMASFALKYLKRHSFAELIVLLDIPHASDVSHTYWLAWGQHLKPFLTKLTEDFEGTEEEHTAGVYALGWLHRLSKTALDTESVQQSPQPSRVPTANKEKIAEQRLPTPPTPKKLPGQYERGAKIEVEVVSNNYGTGDVRFLDGSHLSLKNQNVGIRCQVGDHIKGTVTEVHQNGVVKRLKFV